MGLVASLLCSATFCIERVLTWACCAILLVMIMFIIILLMVYGISVGYHYAQKELASFAMWSRSSVPPKSRRVGEDSPVVRLLAVNRSEVEAPQQPIVENYITPKADERIYLETPGTPIVVLETEKTATDVSLTDSEKELARRLIGRFRRSRNNTTSSVTPFLRPLRTITSVMHST